MKENSSVRIVVMGAGAGKGFKALLNGDSHHLGGHAAECSEEILCSRKTETLRSGVGVNRHPFRRLSAHL
jgi:hypothetical protein